MGRPPPLPEGAGLAHSGGRLALVPFRSAVSSLPIMFGTKFAHSPKIPFGLRRVSVAQGAFAVLRAGNDALQPGCPSFPNLRKTVPGDVEYPTHTVDASWRVMGSGRPVLRDVEYSTLPTVSRCRDLSLC